MRNWLNGLVMIALLAGGTSAARANLVANPGFEAIYDNWTFENGNGGSAGLHGGVHHFGSYSGVLSCPASCGGNEYATISQNINTLVGDTYLVDFWVAPSSCCLNFAETGSATVSFGNTIGFTRTSPNAEFWQPGVWVEYSFQAVASSEITTFTFGTQGLATGGVFIDDISVVNLTHEQSPDAPEPGTWLMAGGALVSGLYLRKRRNR